MVGGIREWLKNSALGGSRIRVERLKTVSCGGARRAWNNDSGAQRDKCARDRVDHVACFAVDAQSNNGSSEEMKRVGCD